MKYLFFVTSFFIIVACTSCGNNNAAFQNIAGGEENYFFINTFSAAFQFTNPSFNRNMWPGNDAKQKYTAGHKSSVFSFSL